MSDRSERAFKVTPSQYELFRFSVAKPSTVYLKMIATAPVNLLLLDSAEREEYERGDAATHTYTAAWGRKRDLESAVSVDPGTWYLIVEGSTEPSSGRIEIKSSDPVVAA